MKKIVALGLALILSLASLAGCSQKTPENVTETINVAALNGPTGMAMVNLMDMEDKYDITTYQAPADVTAKVISGEVDVAAVPSNLAAVDVYKRQKLGHDRKETEDQIFCCRRDGPCRHRIYIP